jgi:hypothetical protein
MRLSKIRNLILTLCIFTPAGVAHAVAKQCTYDNLSKKYNFQITANEEKINITVSSKFDGKVTQKMVLPANAGGILKAPCRSRSYSTGYHADDVAIDGNYGDIVVADLNFNGREDIAIASGFTKGFGQLYTYYLQAEDGKFVF